LVTKSGALAFPNAQFVFVDTEWNYWTGNRYESEVNSLPMPDPFKEATIAAAENLPPVADRARFVKQGGEITSGVHYIAAPGHSPSHASILFASGKEQFMHMGDIAHNLVTSFSGRTRGLVGAAELALMRPTARLVNTSRGPIVIEADLVAALKDKTIAGAAVDVFDQEPLPLGHPLRALPNLLATPHIGYVSRGLYARFYQDTVANICRWLDGQAAG
jgi:hypothetical protein